MSGTERARPKETRVQAMVGTMMETMELAVVEINQQLKSADEKVRSRALSLALRYFGKLDKIQEAMATLAETMVEPAPVAEQRRITERIRVEGLSTQQILDELIPVEENSPFARLLEQAHQERFLSTTQPSHKKKKGGSYRNFQEVFKRPPGDSLLPGLGG